MIDRIWRGAQSTKMGTVRKTFVCAREIKMFHLSDLEDQTIQSVGRSGSIVRWQISRAQGLSCRFGRGERIELHQNEIELRSAEAGMCRFARIGELCLETKSPEGSLQASCHDRFAVYKKD
jgi:hypothetical protein